MILECIYAFFFDSCSSCRSLRELIINAWL
jgi:hypothetical protein